MIFITIGLSLTCVVLGIVAIILWTYLKEEKEDNNFVLNLIAHKYFHRAYGDIIDVKNGPFGRKMILMKPKDLSLKEIMKGEKPLPIKIFFNKNHEVVISKNSLSKGKNINLILPYKADELSEELKNTPFGKAMALYIETQNADKVVIKALDSQISTMASHLKNINGGEATIELMNLYREFLGDVLESSLKTKDKVTNPLGLGQSSTYQ